MQRSLIKSKNMPDASSTLVFLQQELGQIRCTSKLPRRCSRRFHLWPKTIRCVLTDYHGIKVLSECSAIGTGRTHYTIRGLCNTSMVPQCVVTFDMDATVASLGWGWHWTLMGCLVLVLFAWLWNWTFYRYQWQRRLFM